MAKIVRCIKHFCWQKITVVSAIFHSISIFSLLFSVQFEYTLCFWGQHKFNSPALKFRVCKSNTFLPILLVGQRLDWWRIDGSGHVLLWHPYSVLCNNGFSSGRVSSDEHVLVPLKLKYRELLEVVKFEGVHVGDLGNALLKVWYGLGGVQENRPLGALKSLGRGLGYIEHRNFLWHDILFKLRKWNRGRAGVKFFYFFCSL